MLPEKSRIEEIIRIHNELQKLYHSGLERAIRLGELLEEQKKNSKHGDFEGWIEENLPFSVRTARNYRMIFKNREFLKRQAVADLNSAYLLLIEEKDPLKYFHRMERAIQDFYDIQDEFFDSLSPEETIWVAKEMGETVRILEEWGLRVQWEAGRILKEINNESGREKALGMEKL